MLKLFKRSGASSFRMASRSMATAQPAILDRNMGSNQWYLHFSRGEGADLTQIKQAISDFRKACDDANIKAVIGFGPSLLKDISNDIPNDFQNYETFKSIDGSGKEAKGTQEEMLLWINHDDKGTLWKAEYDMRDALDRAGMKLARETMTFIYGNSQDLSGFIDGTGNPEPERDLEVGFVPDGEPGAGGSHIIAQRWIHDLKSFNKLSLEDQEGVFGRTKADSTRLPGGGPAHSHLAHVELREGTTADDSQPKRDEITRRSTPYAFPAPPTGGDGVNGLYFIGFCKNQAPLRERMEAMYGINGQVRDRLTDFSNPASGSFYFAPSVEVLNSL